MASSQELDHVERFLGTFPQDVIRRAQLIGVIRVVSGNDGISAEQIVRVMQEDDRYLPIIGCDENGGVPSVFDVISDLERMKAAGFVAKNGDDWAFTTEGTRAIADYDLRYSQKYVLDSE